MNPFEKALVMAQNGEDVPALQKFIETFEKDHPEQEIGILLHTSKGETVPDYNHLTFAY